MKTDKLEMSYLDTEIETLREEMHRSADTRLKNFANKRTHQLSKLLDELILVIMKKD